jgi:CubicO group peptidase (beta-lactamase class C family)
MRNSLKLTAAALAACALLVQGCAAAPADPLEVRVGDTPNQDVVALPGELDELISAAVEQLPDLAEQALEQTGVPGMAIAVVHGDETIFAEGFGVREIGTDEPVSADTVFQIASISKSLSATGVSAAIGQSDGALDWSTPIDELLPGFAFSDPVVTGRATIGDAFSHRTGLYTGAGDDLEDIGYERDEIFERLVLQPLDAFRSSYHYSNFGLTIGAEAVAASRGEPWEQLMDELVFEPLGMASTSARHDDYLAHEDRALLHAFEDGAFVAAYDRDPDPQSPAGGVSSTANDMANWMRMLLAGGAFEGEQVADPDALAEAMSPQTVSGAGPGVGARPAHYGFGFNASPQVSGRMAVSHSGAFVLGAATNFQVVPELDLGIIALTNGAPVGLPEAVTAQFLDLVQYGHVTRDWVADAGQFFAGYLVPAGDLVDEAQPASPAPSPDSASLAGVYENPYFGPLVIEANGTGLTARIGPDGVTQLALQPWDGETFAYAPSSESAPHGSLASAVFSAEGASVRLSSFDDRGLGTWTRGG